MLLLAVVATLLQDTVRIAADGPGSWPAQLPRPTVLIGTVDGPPELSFGSIEHLAATSNGDFIAYDGKDVQLRYYDASGKFIRTIGRSGAGPGEYRMLMGLVVIGDSLLVVYDAQNSRLGVFGLDGTPRKSVPLQGVIFGGFNPLMAQRSGRVLVRVARAPKPPSTEPAYYLLDMKVTGEVVDSFLLPPEDRPKGHFVLMSPDGPRWSFPDETYHARTPAGGWVHVRSTQNSYTYVPPTGPVRRVTRRMTPLPIEAEERKQWEAWGTMMETSVMKTPVHPLPARKPFFRGVRVDIAERTWLEVYDKPTRREPRPRGPGDLRPQFMLRDAGAYDVFGPSGTYLGRVTLPEDASLLYVTPNRLYVLQHGPDGEEQIAVYSLPAVTNDR